MYLKHFQFDQKPFSITPDPAYLYLSRVHQEALSHLLYGATEAGGFVQLTGEVGTGKTTLIRALLEQDLSDVDVALVLNTGDTPLQFLATICDELHAPLPPDATIKDCVDALNGQLLKNHAAGRRTVLIIDEAQNLPADLLEQIRMLTNLETASEKLLRIMLVGQPELRDLLDRNDLRQLSQRITARYHLSPLNAAETAEYIGHRLRVAGARTAIFNRPALRAVHRLSGGIPRLINVICDRALLGAYSLDTRLVTRRIVHRAADEVLGRRPARRRAPWVLATTLAGLAIAFGPQLARKLPIAGLAVPVAAVATAPSGVAETMPTAAPVPATAPLPEPDSDIVPDDNTDNTTATPAAMGLTTGADRAATPAAESAAAPSDAPRVLDRESGLRALASLWPIAAEFEPGVEACTSLRRSGLECLDSQASWTQVTSWNRPLLAELAPTGSGRFVLVEALSGKDVMLSGDASVVRETAAALRSRITGRVLLLWRREIAAQQIDARAHPFAVHWLRRRLTLASDLPRDENPDSGYFDDTLKQRVIRFQANRGLVADGVVGSRTLVALNNLAPMPGTPTLKPINLAAER